jgi:hypothetical protein
VKKERYAREFVEQGIIRLGSLDQYRTAEDATRDPGEGSAEYQEPLPGRPSELVPTRVEIRNSIFLLCMSDPHVEWSVLMKLGQQVIRINDPRALYDDLRNYFRKDGAVEFLKVRYTRHQRVDRRLGAWGRHRLTYSQKAKRFMPEREWRIALITFDKRYPPGAFARALLGKPLEYCEILPPSGPRPAR